MDKRFVLLTFLTFVPKITYAGFADLGAGARAPGMADAFVAVSDDAAALHYNPAGLAQVADTEISAQYGQFLKGLSDGSSVDSTSLGFARPLKAGRWGTMGVAVHNFKASNYFSDRTVAIGYGANVPFDFFGWGASWSAGITLKQFHRQYETDRYTNNALNDAGTGSGKIDPLFAQHGTNVEQYDADAGLLAHFGSGKKYSLGAALINVGQRDISLQGGQEKNPASFKLGAAYRPRWGVVSAEIRKTKRIASSPDNDTALGLERTLSLGEKGKLGLRAGYAQGSHGFQTITAGLSVRLASVQLDYAFYFPTGNLADTQGNQRIAFSFGFGSIATDQPPKLARRLPAVDHYLYRKSQGAPAEEKLALLQKIYLEVGQDQIDMTWLANEFSGLGN